MPFEVVLTDAPDSSARDAIAKSLAAFNEARGGPSNFHAGLRGNKCFKGCWLGEMV